jgi:hypothetical protein
MHLRSYKKILVFICLVAGIYSKNDVCAQGNGGPTLPYLAFELKTNPTAEFTFNTMSEYLSGITQYSVLTLNVFTQKLNWDLYVGASTNTTFGIWDNIITYGNSTEGNVKIPTSLLQISVSGGINVDTTGFFPMPAISSISPLPYYNIIGQYGNHKAESCGREAPNTPGSYLTNPGCYKFNVNFKIVPGVSYRPGQYSLTVEFFLVQDL